MKVETALCASTLKWGVMYDGLFDTDAFGYASESEAFDRAMADNPGVPIIDSKSPLHYSSL